MQLIRDGDVAPAIAAAQAGHGRRPADGHRRHAGGRDLRRRRSSASAARSRGKLWPRTTRSGSSSSTRARRRPVLTTDDLVAGDDVFVAATGVTDGALLHGVRYTRAAARRSRSSCAHARARCAAIEATTAREARGRSRASRYRSRRDDELPRLRARPVGLYWPLTPRPSSPSPARRRPTRATPFIFARWRYAACAGLDVLRVAAPRLQRRRLQRAPVRERELPRVRPARVHRVQVRGRVLVGLAAREEDDPGHRGRHVAREAARASARRPRRRPPASARRSRTAPCSA